VVFRAVEGVGDGASAGVAHGAEKPVPPGNLEFGDFKQVDAFESELEGPLTELVEQGVFVAPAADGLVDAIFARGAHCRSQRRGESGGDRCGCGGFEKCAAGRHEQQGTGCGEQGAEKQTTAAGNREPLQCAVEFVAMSGKARRIAGDRS
jgi:hypothetical protein